MIIEIKLYGTFKKNDRSNEVRKINIPEGAKVSDLLRILEISPEVPMIILINNKRENLQTQLHSGDIMSIIPPIGGG
jgi:sulfur-carrier protein